MECRARIKSLMTDWQTDKVVMTLELGDVAPAVLENLDDGEMRLTLVRWKEKRSLNANAYCWTLLTEMALMLGTTKEELYEMYIKNHAPIAEDESGHVIITVKSIVKMDRIAGHWKWIADSEDGKWSSYAMLVGSSEFDKEVMSNFLDVIVADAQEMGIDTRTPDEIERMKSLWRSQKE